MLLRASSQKPHSRALWPECPTPGVQVIHEEEDGDREAEDARKQRDSRTKQVYSILVMQNSTVCTIKQSMLHHDSDTGWVMLSNADCSMCTVLFVQMWRWCNTVRQCYCTLHKTAQVWSNKVKHNIQKQREWPAHQGTLQYSQSSVWDDQGSVKRL